MMNMHASPAKLIAAVAALFLWGCGSAGSDAPSFDITDGAHPAGWVASDGGDHRLEFRDRPGQCPQCHGDDILQPVVPGGSGGIARVGCSMTSFEGTICHANGHLPRIAPHPLPFTNPALHGPLAKAGLDGQSGLISCQQCHATSQGGAGSNPRFNAKIGALANGCEDCHNLNAAHPSSNPPDSAPWRGPFTHADARNLSGACALCHGAAPALSGGSGPPCSSCHVASPLSNFNCSSCHGNPPDGAAFPDIGGAHGVHDLLTGLSGDCSVCHDGAGIGTLDHFNRTVEVAIPAVYNAKSGGPAAFIPDTAVPVTSPANNGGECANISCHGGQTTPPFRTGAINSDLDCVSCHRSRSVSDQFNSYFSGRAVPPNFASLHDFHLQAVGLACTDCHNPAKLAANHFRFLTTAAMEGPASATIGGAPAVVTAYNPATSSCTHNPITGCHETRFWDAP
jgi:predicted CxxxxCH...CXXCH cytochrome family protein